MRKFEVCIETRTESITETFEVDDDATQAEIEDTAKDIFYNICNYGLREITDEEIADGPCPN